MTESTSGKIPISTLEVRGVKQISGIPAQLAL